MYVVWLSCFNIESFCFSCCFPTNKSIFDAAKSGSWKCSTCGNYVSFFGFEFFSLALLFDFLKSSFSSVYFFPKDWFESCRISNELEHVSVLLLKNVTVRIRNRVLQWQLKPMSISDYITLFSIFGLCAYRPDRKWRALIRSDPLNEAQILLCRKPLHFHLFSFISSAFLIFSQILHLSMLSETLFF